jgi:DeoR family transcriptional regulator, fructose operon transcriptional repressor
VTSIGTNGPSDEVGVRTHRTLFGPERRRRLMDLLSERGSTDVASLAQRFEVTQETIRRDLTVLEQQGLLHRVHGGAILAPNGHAIPVLSIRRTLMADEKEAVARAALAHIPTDGAIFIDAGSTTQRFAELFRGGRPISVLTNGLPIAITLAGRPGLSVHTVGGRVRPETLAEVDAIALRTLSEVSVDVAFIATSGVSVGHGFSTNDSAEAAAKRAMIHAAKRVIVLTDHSKLAVDHFARFAELREIDLLITDAGADPEVVRALEVGGLKVELAGLAARSGNQRRRGRRPALAGAPAARAAT